MTLEHEPELESTPEPKPRYGPEAAACAEECGAPAGQPCEDLDGRYHRTRVVAANKLKIRDLTQRLVSLTTGFSDQLRPGTVNEITYQADSGRLQLAFSNLLLHLADQHIAVMPEHQDELLALNDVIRGGL